MATTAEQIEQLQAAIAAQERLRGTLPDAVLDTIIATLRGNLAELEALVRPEQQRKQITVLFADVSGFTAMSETRDAEEVAEVLNELWQVIDRTILDHGGRIDKHIGDAVMALWGVDTAREDDPERAIRAALDMQAATIDFRANHNVPLAMRVGINTGPALVGAVGTTGEMTALGDTVNVASRLEQAAPVEAILMGHDTYRHVRGIFDVQPQEPLTVKGKADPMRTYVVLRAKRRAFRMATRGVEGIETRMVGRDSELQALQAAYGEAIATGQTRAVVVVGEAGVGKSRLLYEFDNWLELRPETIRYFRGRATPNTRHVPFSLFRDVFARRADIRDSDSAAEALQKFRAGVAEVLEPGQADVLGHWLGFDFSASEAVGDLLGAAGFAETAQAYLVRYLRAVAAGPAVLLLEDLHWADDLSLDLATHLATTVAEARLLLITAARPSLFERRPTWGETTFQRVTLSPLSASASQALVDEILQQAEDVPDSLRKLIGDTAEGNPFYVEELIKMLIEQGVVETVVETEFLPRNSVSNRWTVRTDKLADLRVPPTLTSLLQARLDGLPPRERETLQRASVVGRLFWDDAVADLLHIPRATVRPILEGVGRRELIFRRDRSAFAHSDEYIFKHALLRDVVYETVLLKRRVDYHGRVARWLEANAGERSGEYLGLIAEHYTQAGELERAAEYHWRSGEQALRAGAYRAARESLLRALSCRQNQPGEATTAEHWLQLGRACYHCSDFAEAESALRQALTLAQAEGDSRLQAEALGVLSSLALSVGQRAEAQSLLDEALLLARPVGGTTLARVLNLTAEMAWRSGQLDAADALAVDARRLAEELGDLSLTGIAIRSQGVTAGLHGDFAVSIVFFEEALSLARRSGNRAHEAKLLSNLGTTKQLALDLPGAVADYRAALEMDEELGALESMTYTTHNLADAHNYMGQLDEARHYALRCLQLARQIGAVPMQLAALVPLAETLMQQGQTARALALAGLVRAHPSTPHHKHDGINQLLAAHPLDPAEAEAGLAAGAALDLETVIEEILGGKW